jgi:hypothetical protein
MKMLALVLALFAFDAHAQGLTKLRPGAKAATSRTNYQIQSGTITTGAALTAGWTGAGTMSYQTVAGAPFSGTWGELTSVTNVSYVYGAPSTPSATRFVGSVYLAKSAGSGYASVWVQCPGAPSTCTCVRSDAGACTAATVAVNNCSAEVSDLGTTAIRLSAIATCGSATTTPYLVLVPGRYGTATGTTRFSAAMLEANVTTPSAYCATTSVAATCK